MTAMTTVQRRAAATFAPALQRWNALDRRQQRIFAGLGLVVSFRAGLFNLTDETYWRWLDVANLAAADPMIPLLSRPGRSYSLNARITF